MTKKNPVSHFVLGAGAITMLFPFVWMILTALKKYEEIAQIPPTLLPEAFYLENFSLVWEVLPYGRLCYNTLALMALRVIFALVTSSLAGYAFGRIKFPGKKLLFSLVLIQMMLPPQIFIIPQYTMVAKLQWLDTIKGLLFPGLVSAFGVFLLRQSFKSIPKSMEEASIVDGCNHFQVFYYIMLPQVRNSLIALGVFTALFAYKELMWPLIVNTSADMMTLSSAIAGFKGMYVTDYTLIMAASFLAMWPMFMIYVIFNRQIADGIAFTGEK